MRSRLILAIVAVTVGLAVNPSTAQERDVDLRAGTGGRVIARIEETGWELSEEEAAAAGAERPVYRYVTIEWVAGSFEFCSRVRFTYDRARADDYDFVWRQRQAEANGGSNIGRCPAGVGTVSTPPPVVFARRFWDERQLPSPSLRAAPGWGIVGKTVFLEIGGPRSEVLSVPNPIGAAITIRTSSRFVVSWGDGSVSRTASSGGPWPSGDVTHVYGHAGSHVVRVVQEWEASWSAGAAGGTLTGLQTEASLPFEVRQVQSVQTG